MAYCTIHGAEDVPGCPECEADPAAVREREDIEHDRNAQIAAGGRPASARAPASTESKAPAKPKAARKPKAKRPARAQPKVEEQRARESTPLPPPPPAPPFFGTNAAAEERLAQDE